MKNILFFIGLLISQLTFCQTDTLDKKIEIILNDSLKITQVDSSKIRSPKKAARLSLVCPGLGQIYNRKYWKLPIVYGALGSTVALFLVNNVQYKKYQKAYLYNTDNDPNTIDEFGGKITPVVLRAQRESYRRNRDLSGFIFVLLYSLTAVDAFVDAHLANFTVSDNLSLQISPAFNYSTTYSAGLQLSFKIK